MEATQQLGSLILIAKGLCWIVNWRLGTDPRWKVEDYRLGMSGSVIWQADTFKVVAPPVSVRDRWVGPREQVLNVPITY
jgi:hypothetical protein